MATKKKAVAINRGGKASARKKPLDKKASKAANAARQDAIKKRPAKPPLKGGIKCCHFCPDYAYCLDRAYCCDYCDFYLNGKCTYTKKKKLPAVEGEIELPGCRGDDFGIDDYEAYEQIYE